MLGASRFSVGTFLSIRTELGTTVPLFSVVCAWPEKFIAANTNIESIILFMVFIVLKWYFTVKANI